MKTEQRPSTMKTVKDNVLLAPIFGPAVVLSVGGEDSDGEVMLEGTSPADTRVSVPASPTLELAPGDRVLVAGSLEGAVYVLSVLERSQRSREANGDDCLVNSRLRKDQPRNGHLSAERDECFRDEHLHDEGPTVIAHDGGSADLDENGHIRVRNSRGEIVFEYDGSSDRSTVRPSGHLEIDAERGMTLKSPSGIRLQSRDLEIDSDHARLRMDTTKFEGKRVDFTVGLIRTFAGRLETVAKTVISKANGVYAQVTELSQLRAGRRRVLVDSTYELRSEKANLRSKRDFKIDGEQIELG